MIRRTIQDTAYRRRILQLNHKLHCHISTCYFSTYQQTETPKDHYDVVIVGGGVVGSALANLLSSTPSTSKLSIGIINPQVPPVLGAYESSIKQDDKVEKATNHHLPNARSYALSPSSLQIIGDESINKISNMKRVAPYNRMQVSY